MKKSQERLVAVILGAVFVAAILIIAIFIKTPTEFQYFVFRSILSISAAGFVAFTPGFIDVTIPKVARAGGALAVFLIVYFYSPAVLPPEPSVSMSLENPSDQ